MGNDRGSAGVLRRRVAALSLLGFLPVCAPAVLANGPIFLPRETAETAPLAISDWYGWTEFVVRAQEGRAGDYELRESIVAPGIHLGTRGSVYHEKALAFDLAATLRYQQRRTWGDEERSDGLTFDDYDASLLVLRDAAANLTVFANRRNAWVDSPFRSSYRLRSLSYGTEMRLRSAVAPASISYAHLRDEEESAATPRVIERERFRASVQHLTSLARTTLSLRREDTEKNVQPQDYRTVSLEAHNTLGARGSSAARLRSRVRYFDQNGSIARRSFGISEDASFDLPANLTSFARYRLHDQRTPVPALASGVRDPGTRVHTGTVGLDHLLYASLRSTLTGTLSREVSDQVSGDGGITTGKRDRKGIDGRLAYTRRTPGGRLGLGVGYGVIREDQEAGTSLRFVANEEHVLEDGNEPQLENGDVDEESIVVSAEDGFTVYEEGIDYTVVTIGRLTTLIRVPGGAIPDGATILVDYSYRAARDLEFDSKVFSWDARFDARRFASVYHRHRSQSESHVSGSTEGLLDDERRDVTGAHLTAKGVSLRGEYETREVRSESYRSTRVSLGYSGRVARRARFHLGANRTRTRLADRGQGWRSTALNARIATPIPGGIETEIEGWIRIDRQDDPGTGRDTDLVGLRLHLTKRLRALAIRAGLFVRNADENDELRDRRRSFFLSLRREF